jgi:hypothetical protein
METRGIGPPRVGSLLELEPRFGGAFFRPRTGLQTFLRPGKRRGSCSSQAVLTHPSKQTRRFTYNIVRVGFRAMMSAAFISSVLRRTFPLRFSLLALPIRWVAARPAA